MSKWFTAIGHFRCFGCRDAIYPGDTMRWDDYGKPLCIDCGRWPR